MAPQTNPSMIDKVKGIFTFSKVIILLMICENRFIYIDILYKSFKCFEIKKNSKCIHEKIKLINPREQQLWLSTADWQCNGPQILLG